MMLGICHREGETRQTWSVIVVAFFVLFSQIAAMVLLLSPKCIKLEGCACAQIEAFEEGDRWLYLDDARNPSKRGRNATNLISDGVGLFCPFFSNCCHGSANISWTKCARKLRLRLNWSYWRGEKVLVLNWCRGFVREREKRGKPDQWWWWPFLPFFL